MIGIYYDYSRGTWINPVTNEPTDPPMGPPSGPTADPTVIAIEQPPEHMATRKPLQALIVIGGGLLAIWYLTKRN